ncbi:MAG: hypothetical protein HC853_10570 [Anaerolineae bacterium]|nr:hypothetical protein [Anaerolineae bacterium]
MELGLGEMETQRVIGQMTQSIMRSLPQDAPKAYLLQPRMFFTFQSLVEAIFEADGVSPDMLRKQQEKADLLRDFMRQGSIEAVREIVRKNDDKVDAEMFDLLAASMDANAGREQVLQSLMGLQQVLIDETTFGKTISARIAVLEAFQKEPTRENLLESVIGAPDLETRESLVAMGRQLLDYAFFQLLTGKIDAAPDQAAKDKLIALRKEVQETRDKVDSASRQMMQGKVQLIQEIVSSKDPMAFAREHEAEIDDTFIAVVQANAQEAQKRNDKNTLDALQAVYNIAMQFMAERQPPEVQIIQALLQAKYPEETEKILTELKDEVDDRFIGVMGRMAEQLAQNDRTDTSAKLTQIMVQARKILPKYDPTQDAAQDAEVSAGAEEQMSEGEAPASSPPPEAEAKREDTKSGSGLIGPDGLIRGSNPPPSGPPPKIEIARR